MTRILYGKRPLSAGIPRVAGKTATYHFGVLVPPGHSSVRSGVKAHERFAVLYEIEDGVTLRLLGESLLNMRGIVEDYGVVLLQALGREFSRFQGESCLKGFGLGCHGSQALNTGGNRTMPKTTRLRVNENLVLFARLDRRLGGKSGIDLRQFLVLLLILGDKNTSEGKSESKGRSGYSLYHGGSRRVR